MEPGQQTRAPDEDWCRSSRSVRSAPNGLRWPASGRISTRPLKRGLPLERALGWPGATLSAEPRGRARGASSSGGPHALRAHLARSLGGAHRSVRRQSRCRDTRRNRFRSPAGSPRCLCAGRPVRLPASHLGTDRTGPGGGRSDPGSRAVLRPLGTAPESKGGSWLPSVARAWGVRVREWHALAARPEVRSDFSPWADHDRGGSVHPSACQLLIPAITDSRAREPTHRTSVADAPVAFNLHTVCRHPTPSARAVADGDLHAR